MKKYIFFALTFTAMASFNMGCKTKKQTTVSDNTPKEDIVEITTSYGTMYMWLYKQTPQHRANFLKLAGEGFFDSTTFHRIIANFMIQGGDPNSKDADTTNDGSGGPSYTIPAEFKDSLKHDFGSVGAARTNNPAKASSGSQFYIVENAAGYHSLDKNYTVFGKIIGGMNAATTIMVLPKNVNNRPYKDIKMSMKIIVKSQAQLKSEFYFIPPTWN